MRVRGGPPSMFRSVGCVLALLAYNGPAAVGAEADFAALEHFEKTVRPLLVERCHACHSSDAPSVFAGLRLDSRAGVLAGGDSGPAIVPGNAADSLLLRALTGQGKVLMPPTGRLSESQISEIAAWIDAGAAWPDEAAPGLPDPAEPFDLERRRSEHWAWQHVRSKQPPLVDGAGWPQSSIDHFLLARLDEAGLAPASQADRFALLRRVSFALTGLPPAPDELAAFANDQSPHAFEAAVDRLLASPHFGERWARHWMDLFRYTESHGSEGDPDIPDAWRYRDYLIRAFNADVPYDQLILENVAGDLLPKPRFDRDLALNESVLGTAHYRMIEHGFQPVEPWEDRVKWTDNQIDVLSKAFQGLTVSCARCHDHKFDAISQEDYYALFGILASARPVQRAVDTPDLLALHREALREAKQRVKDELAELWLARAEELPSRLNAPDVALERALEVAACEPEHPLHAWFELADRSESDLRSGWARMVENLARDQTANTRFNDENFPKVWRTGEDLSGWKFIGTGLERGASRPGEFSILPSGDRILGGIYGSGVFSGLLSYRHNGVLQTPRFKIDSDYISFLVQGSGFSFVRLIVENYAVPRGGIYHQRYSPKKDSPVWFGWDTTYWKGFSAYLEFATMQDSTNFHLDAEDTAKKPRPSPTGDGRSHFGALGVAFHDRDVKPRMLDPAAKYILDAAAPENRESLARVYGQRLGEAVRAWRDGVASDLQATFLDSFVRAEILPATVGASDRLDVLVAEYRQLEDQVPVYRRAPSVLDEEGPDHPLLVRGDHRNLGDPVPRRYLAALGGERFRDPRDARLRLARALASPDNPLTARVMVNRVWSHLFGRGLVPTVDNFGRVGGAPSHPELLDRLAHDFVEDGWSIKRLIRRLLMTAAYRADSTPSPESAAMDPDNALLQHMPVRRLDAEAVRDSLLATTGRFDPRLFGPSVNVFYAFAKGKTKGDREKGPVDGNGRRSVYQEIRRNAHNPFLEVFDQPKPSSTRGLRDSTNVPAQSLTMLNSELVISLSKTWGEQLGALPGSASETVRHMFLAALGREPSSVEVDECLGYVGPNPGPGEWADLAHSIFNLKEFLYVR